MFRITITEIRKDVTNVLRALKFKFKQLQILYKNNNNNNNKIAYLSSFSMGTKGHILSWRNFVEVHQSYTSR